MSTFIVRLDSGGTGPRLAVKDLIDMEGLPTSAGSRAVADDARAADRDAECLTAARSARARIVGKTNLHELAFGVTGVNPWFGTPRNPLDPSRVPGGSSSGSAVAVADGDADVALGTDTGGSVRIPSACCGTAGLKTTFGRISTKGVRPLSPSLDTVGPMARDTEGLVLGMSLLEPGFEMARTAPTRVGRVRVSCDPVIDAAIDSALDATGWDLAEVAIPEWDDLNLECGMLLVAEAWGSCGALAHERAEMLGTDVLERLQLGRDIEKTAVDDARRRGTHWKKRLEELFDQVELLATPTLTIFPPTLEEGEDLLMARCTLPANFAGVPALTLPVPSTSRLPASLQLIGPANSEDLLLAAGRVVESVSGL